MPSDSRLTVAICTHNPRETYLRRTLEGLTAQTFDRNAWDLLIIDNASDLPVADRYNISWHRHGRHVIEPHLGLTAARRRAIAETSTELVVFVDDDNVLAPDYLAVAAKVAIDRPWLGAWGGWVEPEFEVPPPRWLAPYLSVLAVNEVPIDQWSNYVTPASTPPCGAGMCVRQGVAKAWSDHVVSDPRRAALGRTGASLASCEDTDLAFTACDLGLGAGRLSALRLRHLLAKERLELDYIARLIENLTASQIVLRSLRESMPPPNRPGLLDRLRDRWRDWLREPAIRRICQAERRGRDLGYAQLAALRSKSR